jgi:hypothetical protein
MHAQDDLVISADNPMLSLSSQEVYIRILSLLRGLLCRWFQKLKRTTGGFRDR